MKKKVELKIIRTNTETFRRPFACPVCGGRTIVSVGFYEIGSSTTANGGMEKCRTCINGIVWCEDSFTNTEQEVRP